jgi:hypothetical protein
VPTSGAARCPSRRDTLEPARYYGRRHVTAKEAADADR